MKYKELTDEVSKRCKMSHKSKQLMIAYMLTAISILSNQLRFSEERHL